MRGLRYHPSMHGINRTQSGAGDLHTTTRAPRRGRHGSGFAAGIMAGILAAWGIALSGCVSGENGADRFTRFEYAAVRMGTQARVVLYAVNESSAAAAAREAFATIERLEQIMSDYRPTSELNQFAARSGTGWVAISPDLARVLTNAARVSRASGGAFDVTIGPATTLWRAARDAGRSPDEKAVQDARALIDWSRVNVDPGAHRAAITTPGVRLDLGGIGKGYAAWEALRRLRELGHPRSLVSLAGDIAVGQAPPGARGWTISIAWPGADERVRVLPSLLLTDATISTSGAAEQWIAISDGLAGEEPGEIRRSSHVIDPRTAQGVWTTRAITVVGPHGDGSADALATAGLVLLSRGDEEGLRRMMAEFPRFAAIVAHGSTHTDDDGTVAGAPHDDDILVIGDRNALHWTE